MEHIEQAGIHSGNSACVIPPVSIPAKHLDAIYDLTRRIARELNVVGLMNIQYAIERDKLYVLEANPRASRTVPLVSKVCNVQMARIATELMLGKKLSAFGLKPRKVPHFGVKEAVFPFHPILGPEMRSTGEVLGMADSFGGAFFKAQEAAKPALPLAARAAVSHRSLMLQANGLTSPAAEARLRSPAALERSMSQTLREALLVLLAAFFLAACSRGCEEPEPAPPPPPSAPAPAPPEPARAALTINPNVPYTIVAAASGKCLQFAGGTSAIHARLVLAGCDGSPAQQFRLAATPDNYQTIANVQSKKCVDVEGVATTDGAHVQQFECHGGPNQQWIVADGSGGTLRLVARHSGKSMDVEGAATADGTAVNQWTWNSQPNQQFKLNLVQPTGAAENKGAGDTSAGGATGSNKTGNSKGKGKSPKGKKHDKTHAAAE